MKTLFVVILTGILSNIIGAVILIRVGGWLPTLVAILSLCFAMLISSLVVIAMGSVDSIKKNHTEHFNKEAENP